MDTPMLENTMEFKALAKEDIWKGGWYQPIVFPDGSKTASSKWEAFHERDDFGKRKWEKYIKPYLVGKDTFLEIGCNAGLFLVLAEQYGYKNVYGLESMEYFYEQCSYVLKKFDSKAITYMKDALCFDYDRFKSVDTLLLANTLYWIGYKDSGKYVEDYELKLNRFMRRMSFLTKRIIITGGEKVDRIGGSLSITEPFISKYFNIVKSEVLHTGHRILNLIVADTKVIEGEVNIDLLIKRLEERGDYAKEFVKTYGAFINGYIEHKKWIQEHGGEFRGKVPDDFRVHNFCVNYLNLAKSINDNGLLRPVEIFKSEGMMEIDGWHRLMIMKALGYKTIKYRAKEDVKVDL